MEKGERLKNIILLIIEFLVVGGLVVGILDFFNILTGWTRIALAIVIALIPGLIIYFRKEKRGGKSLKK